MAPPLEQHLQRLFGFSGFRPGQKELVQSLLDGRDALGVMPTGGGKSLCFQLPAALMPGTAIVISPLIALMKDQVDGLRARGIAAWAYNSSLPADERREAREAMLSGRAKLLYMAPERMQHEGFMDWLGRVPVSFLAIDEAHCISHWGHDFRPDYRKLGDLRRLLKSTDPQRILPVMALTATATQQVQHDIVERLAMREPARVVTGFRRENLSFEVHKCGNRAEKFRVLRELIAEATADGGSAVVYAATRKNVEMVAAELGRGAEKKSTDYYHAGLSDTERAEVQDDFLHDRKRVLVATNAFGMGIDKSTVRLVAHFDIPGSVEAYYQEAGRAGRDGKPGRCALLFNYADVATQEFFITNGADDTEESNLRVRTQQALLKQLVRYAYSNDCRQKLILEYFGDPEARRLQRCEVCDTCKPPVRDLKPADEWTSLACHQALAAVARVNGRFGKGRISEILKGSRSAQVVELRLDTLKTFGLLAGWTLPKIKELIDLLLDAGYLRVVGLDYPVLSLTQEGVDAMKGTRPVMLPRPFDPREGGGRSGRANAGAGSSGKGASAAEPLLAEADAGLLEKLREFRREEARKRNVPAYVVFHDRTLGEIAARKPRDADGLSAISGLGPKKIETYGPQILTIVQGSPQP